MLAISDNGSVVAGGNLVVWNAGTVDIFSGTLTAQSVDHTHGGTLNHTGGTLTIDGGTFNNGGGPLTVSSASGNPLMRLVGGGTASQAVVNLGLSNGENGALEVSGAGSTLTNSQHIFVGKDGSGTLSITDGASVSNATSATIGNTNGSTGLVTVDGTDSTWDNNVHLLVGGSGNGTLNITGGGSVTNTFVYIASSGDSVGVVTVDGANSTWTSSDFLTVGRFGDGTLNITDGGSVSNTEGFVGAEIGSVGTVMVDGAGSTWTNSNDLSVGGNSGAEGGQGTLTVAGGNVTVGTLLKIWPTGTLNLSGGTLTTPELELQGQLDFDSGTLNITGSGALVGTGGTVGTAFGTLLNLPPNGTLNVSGGAVDVAADGATTR